MRRIKTYFKKLFKVLSIVRLRDAWDLVKIIVSCPMGLVLKLFKRHIWIVSEMEHTARDNGYWFFKYMRENYPDRPVYYPIQFDAPDYLKVARLGNVLRHGSFKHHIYCWAAQVDISARTGRGFPAPFMCHLVHLSGIYPFKTVFLQHGVTMNAPPFLMRERNRIDLFLAATESEAKGIHEDLGYDVDKIKVVGFTRYDELNEFHVDKKQILLMPTWRQWLYPNFGTVTKDAEEKVKNSNYVQTYCRLLASQRLNTFLQENDLNILFFPHNQMQPFLSSFTGENSRIKIASTEECDVQTALKESAYLITDYSSISFDFAYMKKPMSYFHFDYDEFREKHYPEGYFSYDRDGFGPISRTEDELIEQIISSYKKDFVMDEEYKNRVDNTFKYRDNENCKRTLEAIENLVKR